MNIVQMKSKIDSIKSRVKGKYYRFKKPSIVKIKGILLSVPENSTKKLEYALYYGYYEDNELKTVVSKLEPNDTVMELGTGLGLLSTFCAKNIGSDRVFTYEANPQLEPIIKQNYALNEVNPQLENCMLGSQSGQENFYVSDNLWDSSKIKYHENLRSIQVNVRSFNDEIKKINPSFLIMDIEGGEYELCQYADFYNVKKLAMELHEDLIGTEKANFVRAKLKDAGFRINKQFSYGLQELFWERN